MNGASRVPKCLFDPAIFSFRSISRGYSALTPVEEPSCAYWGPPRHWACSSFVFLRQTYVRECGPSVWKHIPFFLLVAKLSQWQPWLKNASQLQLCLKVEIFLLRRLNRWCSIITVELLNKECGGFLLHSKWLCKFPYFSPNHIFKKSFVFSYQHEPRWNYKKKNILMFLSIIQLKYVLFVNWMDSTSAWWLEQSFILNWQPHAVKSASLVHIL